MSRTPKISAIMLGMRNAQSIAEKKSRKTIVVADKKTHAEPVGSTR